MRWGSSICEASSMTVSVKVFIFSRERCEFIEVVVLTNTLVVLMMFLRLSILSQPFTFSLSRWSL